MALISIVIDSVGFFIGFTIIVVYTVIVFVVVVLVVLVVFVFVDLTTVVFVFVDLTTVVIDYVIIIDIGSVSGIVVSIISISSLSVVGACRSWVINVNICINNAKEIMLKEIYFLKHYFFSIIYSIIILRLKLYKLTHDSST